MENLEDIKISLRGYDTEAVNEIISEKNRVIDVAMRDVESLKREISDLKDQINKSQKKRWLKPN